VQHDEGRPGMTGNGVNARQPDCGEDHSDRRILHGGELDCMQAGGCLYAGVGVHTAPCLFDGGLQLARTRTIEGHPWGTTCTARYVFSSKAWAVVPVADWEVMCLLIWTTVGREQKRDAVLHWNGRVVSQRLL
jgi:hypothetical protein